MLQTLYKIVKDNSTISSQVEFMSWFLGNSIALEDSMLKYLYKEERQLSLKNKRVIAQREEWKLNYFVDNKEKFEREMRELYKSIFFEAAEGRSLEELLLDILNQYLFGTNKPGEVLMRYEGVPCKNYIDTKEYYEFIEKAWVKSNIIVLYGEGGIGKTQLVKSYLNNKKGQYDEICILNECGSVQSGLLYLPFWLERKMKIKDILKILEKKDEKMVIAIDVPVLSNDDIEFIRNKLNGLKTRIIITTYKKIGNINAYQQNIRLDDGTLRKIFEKNLDGKKYEFTDMQFTKLLNIVDRNTLVIALLGRCLKRKDIPVEKLINEHEWIWGETQLPTAHANDYGQKSDKSPIYHICTILEKYGIFVGDCNGRKYAELSLWCRNEMNVVDLEKWCTHSIADSIKDGVNRGILEYTNGERTIVEMHSLIADAIWKMQPLRFKEYQENIKKFLLNTKWGEKQCVEYKIVYDALYNLVQRFSFEFLKNDKPQIGFEKYEKMLDHIITYSVKSGNFYGAQRIMYFWNKLLLIKDCNIFDKLKKELWEIEIFWGQGDEEEFKQAGLTIANGLTQTNPETDLINFLKVILNYLRPQLDWYIRAARYDERNYEKMYCFYKSVEQYLNLSYEYSEFSGKIDQYSEYYRMVLLCIFKAQLGDINFVEQRHFCEKTSYLELSMAVKLECLYQKLKHLLFNKRSKEERIKLIQEYEEVKKEYEDKIWTIHMDNLFNQLQVLKEILQTDKEKVGFKLECISSTMNKRLNVKDTSQEQKRMEELLPKVLKQLNDSQF